MKISKITLTNGVTYELNYSDDTESGKVISITEGLLEVGKHLPIYNEYPKSKDLSICEKHYQVEFKDTIIVIHYKNVVKVVYKNGE